MAQQTAVPKMAEQAVVPEAEPYEPLLPIEKKLIVWSLILGVALLLVLVFVSYALFPGVR